MRLIATALCGITLVSCGGIENSTVATTDETSFRYAIMSDPQLFWRCHPTNPACGGENEKEDGLRSNSAMVGKIKALQKIQPILGLIVNGDLTANGGDDELAAYRQFYSQSSLNIPVFPGLGNHDYQLNIGGCADNSCARRMLDYMNETTILHLQQALLNTIDWHESPTYYKFPSLRKDHWGSMSYSWDVKGWHFVQLQLGPTYKAQFDGWNYPGARRDYYQITSSLTWLRQDLEAAVARGQHIILNMHDFNRELLTGDDFVELLRIFPVRAIFAGHVHYQAGEVDQIKLDGSRSIPVFRSGSSAYGTLLTVDFSADQFVVAVEKL